MAVPAASHPTDQTLASYGLGKLEDTSARSVSKHLESCPKCQRRVAEMSADSFLPRLQNAQGQPDQPAAGWRVSRASLTDRGSPVPISPPPAQTMPPGLAEHPDYGSSGNWAAAAWASCTSPTTRSWAAMRCSR